MKEEIIIADKGYVSKDFAEEMEKRDIVFIAIKKENMIKSNEETEYSKLRKNQNPLISRR